MQRISMRPLGLLSLSLGIGLVASTLVAQQQTPQQQQQQRLQQRQQQQQSQEQQRQGGEKQFCLATKVIGTTVKAQGEEEAGEIQNLIINREGQVQFLALKSSGQGQAARTLPADQAQPQNRAAGTGGQWTLIPWELAKFHEGATKAEQYVSLDIEKDRLMKAPTFSEEQLMAENMQTQVVAQVNQYFNTRGAARPDLNRQRNQQQDQNRQTTPQPKPEN